MAKLRMGKFENMGNRENGEIGKSDDVEEIEKWGK